MTARARLIGAVAAAVGATVLGVCAAWPIYAHGWLVITAAIGTTIGCGVALLGARRWGMLPTTVVLAIAFALTVVPAAVPSAFDTLPDGLLRAELDGIAAIVLGWKQLLTLSLPIGTYQAVLVPAFVVFVATAFGVTSLALRSPRGAPAAALILVAPVAFGTIFGASAVSAPLRLGWVTVVAPRELALWLAAAVLGGLWVWFTAGAKRRAALRLGRTRGERRAGSGRATRSLIGVVTVVVALGVGLAVAPVLEAGSGGRQVPRDRVEPEIILRERPSPLAAYRASKRDDAIDTTMFTVSADGALPERLRLAVLDEYDGVDFHVSADAAGRFTRFPSGDAVPQPTDVSVQIGEGYQDVWVPTAGLGSVPVFTGDRAAELADAFYVNRATGAAIAVPSGRDPAGTSTGVSVGAGPVVGSVVGPAAGIGLTAGDGYTVTMSAEQAGALIGDPLPGGALFDLEAMPELSEWVNAQQQPATAEGLVTLIERLRERGYLSHSLGGSSADQRWLERLAARYGTSFEPSAGGHSVARIEALFAQLNAQERLAGDGASPEMLVAGIGDDEQFAAAAALIARALGFESRVVLGVRLGGEGVEGVPACTAECTGEHLAAWIEVRGSQGEWVPIDVTPQATTPATTLETGEQLPEYATTPEERDAREVDPPIGLGERSDHSEVTEEVEDASPWWPVVRAIGLILAALVLIVLPFLFLPFAKRRRETVRRRETDPELRALGAWQQMIDEALDAGVRFPTTATRREIGEVLGTAAARWAAQTATKAVFSPQGVTDEEADWMWQAVDADRAERLATLSRWQRLRAKYRLRSYGVRPFGQRAEGATLMMRRSEQASPVNMRRSARNGAEYER